MKISDLEYLESSYDFTELLQGGVYTSASAQTYAGYQQGSASSNASASGEQTLTNAQTSTTVNNGEFYSTTTSLGRAYGYANTDGDTSSSFADSQSWGIYN